MKSANDSVVDLTDIQSHLVSGTNTVASKHYFFQLTNSLQFAQLLQSASLQTLLMAEASMRQRSRTQPLGFINLGFSYRGLVALGLTTHVLDQFPEAFKQGMAYRSHFIGDLGTDAPNHWESYYGSSDVHLLLSIHWVIPGPLKPWSEQEQLAHWRAIDELWQTLCGPGESTLPGTTLLMTEAAHAICKEGQRTEHFGFVDGISQPWVDTGKPTKPGGGKKVAADGTWQALAAGEFVLGYGDELYLANHPQTATNKDMPLPEPETSCEQAYHRLTKNGSFMVFRKLEQDVAGFRAFCSAQTPGFAEQLMGRRYDGQPLASSKPKSTTNDFDFSDDPKGAGCPFSSHVRRVNPRLGLAPGSLPGTSAVDQHRIIRRGMPYGQPLGDCAGQPMSTEQTRGMFFICYNSKIDSQFEFIQKHWINHSDFMSFSSTQVDPIVGNRTADQLGMFVGNQSSDPVFGLTQFVHLKGGEYFFTPGISGCSLLAGLCNNSASALTAKEPLTAFDPQQSDPIDVERFLDPREMLAGTGYTHLQTQDEAGSVRDYYYFAKPQDIVSILGQPEMFTNDLYRARIQRLTGGDMLLSKPHSQARTTQKDQLWQFLKWQQGEGGQPLMQTLKNIIDNTMAAVSHHFSTQGSIDLVAGIAAQVPLQINKHFFGIKDLDMGQPPYSLAQIAHVFGRTSFAEIPAHWQAKVKTEHSQHPDEALMFWVRMMFLEVFTNQYDVAYISDLAGQAAAEFLPKLDTLIERTIQQPPQQPSVLAQVVKLYQSQQGLRGPELVTQVRQTILEFIVGSTDTTTKGIVNTVQFILDHGHDFYSGLIMLLDNNADGLKLVRDWSTTGLDAKEESSLDSALNQIITSALRINPVAPLIPRYCPHGANFITANQDLLTIAPGSVVLLMTKLTTMAAHRKGVATDDEVFLFADGTIHGCMGKQLAMLQIRQVIKHLLKLDQVRRAAGPSGELKEKYRLPMAMELRCQ